MQIIKHGSYGIYRYYKINEDDKTETAICLEIDNVLFNFNVIFTLPCRDWSSISHSVCSPEESHRIKLFYSKNTLK